MAGGLAGEHGGIRSLLILLDEHQEAIEYDLIRLGLRLDWLGTPRLSWRDLLVIVKQSPRSSALAMAVHGEQTQWGVLEHLTGHVVDLLQLANWQRGGKKAGPRPKPIPRPGSKDDSQRFGHEPIAIKDFNDWWFQKGA